MTPLSILNRIWAAGLDLEVVGDTLRFSGSSRLPQPDLDALLAELKAHKAECLTYLRESACADLALLTRVAGLRWALHDEGRAIMPDYAPRFTPMDVADVEQLRLQASPLPHERRHELLKIQEKAESAKLAKRGWK